MKPRLLTCPSCGKDVPAKLVRYYKLLSTQPKAFVEGMHEELQAHECRPR